MVRRRKAKPVISPKINKVIQTDPKFKYKCFVRIENYDVCKLSSEPLNEKKLADNKTLVEKDNVFRTAKNKFHTSVDIANFFKPLNEPKPKALNQRNNNMAQPKKILKAVKPKLKDITLKTDQNSNFSTSESIVEPKCLRMRGNVNYKEKSSIGTPRQSVEANPENGKIPIYKKIQIDSPKSRKRKGDMYDFIPDSDCDADSDVSFRLPVKKKKTHFLPRHNEKVTQHKGKITQNNEKSTRPNVKRALVVKYNDKINGIMHKLASKLKKNETPDKQIETNVNTRRKIDHIGKNHDKFEIFNSTMLPDSQKIVLLNESLIEKGNGQLNESRKLAIPASENSSFNTPGDSNSNMSSLHSLGNMSVRSFDGGVDNLFGFDDEISDNTGRELVNRINILQNVVINQSTPSRQYISTPKPLKQRKSWRFDTSVNRNPHFITIKKNSLPSLNQEPILDHTFEDRINEVNKTISVPSAKKSPKQQSILNFIESTKEHTEKHNFSQSLYDIDELSPLKNKSGDKENSLEKKTLSNDRKRAKRNILGIIDANVTIENSPNEKQDLLSTSVKRTSEAEDLFGFDSTTEGFEEQRARERQAKPFRVEFTYKKSKKVDVERLNQPVRDSEVHRLIEEDPGFDNVVEQDGLDCGQLGLFEEIEESPKAEKGSKPCTKKRNVKDTNKKKNTEVKLSKEAKSWIKQFNKMCDEVDNEELEVE